MPATRSRMSVSSSTMRMSAGMALFAHCGLLFTGGDMAGGGKTDADPGATLVGHSVGGVAQLNRSPVLFNDAADDGETQACALLARGHVRLKQPVAVLLGQADAVIDHVDYNVVAVAGGKDSDRSFAQFCRRHRGDRFGRV